MKFYNKDINTIAINALIDCGEITLATIGSLRCKLLPSAIKNGAITPPRQVVEFHCKSKEGINTLSQLIAWSYSITLEESDKVYQSWLNNIRSQTTDGIIYTIDGLGSICISVNNCIIFTAAEEFSEQLNPLNQEFPQESISIPESEQKAEPTKKSNRSESLQKTDESSNEPFWKSTAMVFIILFIAASSAAILMYFKKPVETIREIKIEKIITDTIYVNEPKAANSTSENITDGKYHIIAGVFKSEANARKVADKFSLKGIAPIIEFIKEREEYFISIKSFDSQQEAQKYLNTLGVANEETLESYWIYKF